MIKKELYLYDSNENPMTASGLYVANESGNFVKAKEAYFYDDNGSPQLFFKSEEIIECGEANYMRKVSPGQPYETKYSGYSSTPTFYCEAGDNISFKASVKLEIYGTGEYYIHSGFCMQLIYVGDTQKAVYARDAFNVYGSSYGFVSVGQNYQGTYANAKTFSYTIPTTGSYYIKYRTALQRDNHDHAAMGYGYTKISDITIK